MRKEKLIDLFQGLSADDIQPLPEELSICWYPSSGIHYTRGLAWNGYLAAEHWVEQPSKLKPNFFIFSDIEEFQTPPQARILLNRRPPQLTQPPKTNQFLSDYNQHLRQDGRFFLFDWGLGSFEDFNKVIRPTDINELNEREAIFGYRRMILHYYQGHYFLLLQTENKNVYDRFMNQNIQIPMLTINRPCDEFITGGGLSLDNLGVQELIVGQVYHYGLDLHDFQKHQEFIFQTFDNVRQDMAYIYSKR